MNAGADFNGPPIASQIVTRLVLEQAGGEIVGPMAEVIVPELEAKTAGRAPIVLRVPEVQRHLGTTLEDAVWGEGREDVRPERERGGAVPDRAGLPAGGYRWGSG